MLKAYIDSISGDVARVLIGDEAIAVAIPVSELPRGVRDGVMLRLRFTIDPTAPMPKSARSGSAAYDAE